MNLHHVGIWVDDPEEMIQFLTEVLGFRQVSRVQPGAVDRTFIHAGGDQYFEILSKAAMQPRPNVPHHPVEAVVAVPHICLRANDLPAWEQKLKELGYTVYRHPMASAFGPFELGRARNFWFTGPGGVDFEMIEFEEEDTG